MENFFVDDVFCKDLHDLLHNVLEIDEEDIADELADDWQIAVELTELQPIFQIDMDYMVKAAMSASDKFEDRFGDDESQDKLIEDAFKAGIDIDKINAAMPILFYPSGKKEVITKQDLLDL
jgi:hypothetical protein